MARGRRAEHAEIRQVRGPQGAWAPYLLLWLGLVFGAVRGAVVYPRLGIQALWIASLAAVCLAISALKMTTDAPDRAGA